MKLREVAEPAVELSPLGPQNRQQTPGNTLVLAKPDDLQEFAVSPLQCHLPKTFQAKRLRRAG